jgi:transcriptional regulator with XRE-family HTH domain
MKNVRRRFTMRLKTLRMSLGLSQEALAHRIGFSRAYVARLEIGRHDPPLSTIVKLAKALKVPVSALVE